MFSVLRNSGEPLVLGEFRAEPFVAQLPVGSV